jgi:hypothetical protein
MAQDTTPPSGGRPASDFRDIADALRTRVDLFGKTLAAVATLGTTAVGLSKIGDLFPAKGNLEWVIAACTGLAIAALAAIWVAIRLMRVARPIFVRADLESVEELDSRERKAVQPVFEAAAKRFGYTSLVGLEEREQNLRSAASHTTDKDERTRRTALADAVKTEIEQALAIGQVVVIRRRAANAVSGPLTWLLYFSVIGGLIAFAIGTDKVSSDRTDPIASAKACGEARTAGATAAELGRTKKICDAKGKDAAKQAEQPGPPSMAEARAQITRKLAAALEACSALVHTASAPKSGPLANEDCDPVRTAVSGMDPAAAPRPRGCSPAAVTMEAIEPPQPLAGERIIVRFKLTKAGRVHLSVDHGEPKRFAVQIASHQAKSGEGTISWNGKVAGVPLMGGRYYTLHLHVGPERSGSLSCASRTHARMAVWIP